MSDRAKLKSAVLCDGAMRVGRKWTLQGVFDGIWSQNFPSNPISFWIHFQFVGINITPESKLTIEIRRTTVEDMEGETAPVCGGELSFKSANGDSFQSLRNQSIGSAVPFYDVVFPEQGIYDVSFFVDGTLIEVWSLEARQIGLAGEQ